MGDIKQIKHIIDPPLNLEQICQRKSINKKFGTHIKRTLNF